MANSREQPSEPNRDHEGNLNSPSHFFIDFANKAMACAPTARTIADDFHELPAYAKEKVLKGLVDEIMENLLKVLPEVKKEGFLDDCFKDLYEKLPWKSQVSVAKQVLDKLSTTPTTPDHYGAPKLSMPVPKQWPLMPVDGRRLAHMGWPGQGPPVMMLEPEEPLSLGLISMDFPETIGSGNGQGRGRGQEGVKK